MIIGSYSLPLVKGQTTNSTVTAFTAAMGIPTITQPAPTATRTIIGETGGCIKRDQVTLKVLPYGGDTNNDVVNYKVQGWNRVQTQTGLPSVLWISRVICEVQGTLSSALLGVAGMAMVATEFFCDTITLTTGFAILHNGTADIDVAWFEVDTSSYEIIEVLYDLGAGGDQANVFYTW